MSTSSLFYKDKYPVSSQLKCNIAIKQKLTLVWLFFIDETHQQCDSINNIRVTKGVLIIRFR
ncbi:hypothetical protein V1478_011439 [Vespula squamosa]|uniref:Uncharacterized protein n=1 Tax=Vespula squamosa TaxID=30214 RepID=A0ABD2AGN7_VESSQ